MGSATPFFVALATSMRAEPSCRPWRHPRRQRETTEHRVGRVISFFSSRRHWDSPNPSPAGECAPPRFWGGGTLASERGVGRVPIPTRGHTLWYSLYIRTLCEKPSDQKIICSGPLCAAACGKLWFRKLYVNITVRAEGKVFHRSNHMYEFKHFGMVWQRRTREKCCGAQRKPYF